MHLIDMVKGSSKQAVLKDYDGDLSKEWYIEFYLEDPVSNKRKRKMIYGNINYYKTKAERYEVGRYLEDRINEQLEKGTFSEKGLFDTGIRSKQKKGYHEKIDYLERVISQKDEKLKQQEKEIKELKKQLKKTKEALLKKLR